MKRTIAVAATAAVASLALVAGAGTAHAQRHDPVLARVSAVSQRAALLESLRQEYRHATTLAERRQIHNETTLVLRHARWIDG